jgi:hypothetical protein
MTVIGFCGVPCEAGRCNTVNEVKQRATHNGLCARCWYGSTDRERRDAAFGQIVRDPLDSLYRMPAREPPGLAA